MRKRLLSLAALAAAAAGALAGDHTKYVDPLIGTQTDATGALSGGTFPGATVPQGMVQLSPDTERYVTWDPCSGYDYDRDSIHGFTHTHLSGTGCTDLIDVSLMPSPRPVTPELLAKGEFGLPFSHREETARPGYYSVRLGREGIRAELTATTRAGVHRYTFPPGAERALVLDLDRMTWRGDAYYAGRRVYGIIQSQLRAVNDRTLEGFRVVTGWARLRKVYFRVEFSQPVRSRLLMDGGRLAAGAAVVNGRALRAALDFGKDGPAELTVKVSVSPVDSRGARQNMRAEAPGWDFDAYARAADQAWERQLSLADIEAGDEEKTVFYTGLYHVLIQPNTMSDADGRYVDTNFETRRMPDGQTLHSTFSLWDTFRAAHPLYSLLLPSLAAQFTRDMTLHQQTYGYLPIWDLWGQENYCMVGNHAIPVLAYAILAELPGVDREAAYRAMVESSDTPHPNSPFDLWERYGYMPQNRQGQSVSITLEQAFDDWCVAAAARKLGHEEDCRRFTRRSGFWRNLFDPATGFFRPKDDKGRWTEPFDPLSYGMECFAEGNAWQYLWFVPHDPQGLIGAMGGREAFLRKLDENFTLESDARESGGNASGFIGQYAHGNEPSHHTAYLYTLAGRPRRTQELVARIRSELYNATPHGYAGNDDCGQMSAWYVFSALGFYPVNAGSAEYVIGTPLYTRATLHLAGGKDFTVTAPRKRPGDIHVRGVRLNGRRVTDWRLTHSQIMAGGELAFTMGGAK